MAIARLRHAAAAARFSRSTAALRQQLAVLHESGKVVLSRLWSRSRSRWRSVLVIVQPRTLVEWHRWLANVMGIEGVPTPCRAPNANALVERFNLTLRREALDHFVFLSEQHVRRVAREYVEYYNRASLPGHGSDSRSLRRAAGAAGCNGTCRFAPSA
jgi:transposase InsO family protein